MVKPGGKNWQFLIEINIQLTYDLAILLDIFPRETKAYIHKKGCLQNWSS